jgi:hypothetical protein
VRPFQWLAEREAELLPVPYYHVVFTLPAAIDDIAYQNKAVIYDLLFKASAETPHQVAGAARTNLPFKGLSERRTLRHNQPMSLVGQKRS